MNGKKERNETNERRLGARVTSAKLINRIYLYNQTVHWETRIAIVASNSSSLNRLRSFNVVKRGSHAAS